jgi:hypothetical protein
MRQPPADRTEVERALRRVYPTGTLDEPDLEALDQHLRGDRLEALFHAIASLRGLNAVLEVEIVRSHVLRIGTDDTPDWERLNREFGDRQRKAAVAAAREGLLYWNIMLSRIGPFWSEYWNLFQVREGIVVPEVVHQPRSSQWMTIINQVRPALATFGVCQVSEDMLAVPVPWLTVSSEIASKAPPRRATVYDGLFSDIY